LIFALIAITGLLIDIPAALCQTTFSLSSKVKP
jgi:hypothetical protein